MNRARWRVAGISVVAATVVAWGGSWVADRLIPITYPGDLSFKQADEMPPRVDLASVQRDWPGGMDEPGERDRIDAYMHDIERRAPPPVAALGVVSVPAAPLDLGTLFASADTNEGRDKARVCTTCHDFAPGGPNRVGPNLWGIIGRKVASRPGFSYSSAMAAQRGVWTYDRLFTYLASPARAVPGNKMGFPGLRQSEDRAAVIKYLTSLGNNPPPFPQPQTPSKGRTIN
jgi:cytochrome c